LNEAPMRLHGLLPALRIRGRTVAARAAAFRRSQGCNRNGSTERSR
jgi:hypothetical protein